VAGKVILLVAIWPRDRYYAYKAHRQGRLNRGKWNPGEICKPINAARGAAGCNLI